MNVNNIKPGSLYICKVIQSHWIAEVRLKYFYSKYLEEGVACVLPGHYIISNPKAADLTVIEEWTDDYSFIETIYGYINEWLKRKFHHAVNEYDLKKNTKVKVLKINPIKKYHSYRCGSETIDFGGSVYVDKAPSGDITLIAKEKSNFDQI